MVPAKLSVCTVAVLLFAAGLPASAQDKPDPEFQSFKSDAVGAIKGLAQNLKKELQAAMKAGGPVKAIGFATWWRLRSRMHNRKSAG